MAAGPCVPIARRADAMSRSVLFHGVNFFSSSAQGFEAIHVAEQEFRKEANSGLRQPLRRREPHGGKVCAWLMQLAVGPVRVRPCQRGPSTHCSLPSGRLHGGKVCAASHAAVASHVGGGPGHAAGQRCVTRRSQLSVGCLDGGNLCAGSRAVAAVNRCASGSRAVPAQTSGPPALTTLFRGRHGGKVCAASNAVADSRTGGGSMGRAAPPESFTRASQLPRGAWTVGIFVLARALWRGVVPVAVQVPARTNSRPALATSLGAAAWWEGLCRFACCVEQPRRRPEPCPGAEERHSGVTVPTGSLDGGKVCARSCAAASTRAVAAWAVPVQGCSRLNSPLPLGRLHSGKVCAASRAVAGTRDDGVRGHAGADKHQPAPVALFFPNGWWESLCRFEHAPRQETAFGSPVRLFAVLGMVGNFVLPRPTWPVRVADGQQPPHQCRSSLFARWMGHSTAELPEIAQSFPPSLARPPRRPRPSSILGLRVTVVLLCSATRRSRSSRGSLEATWSPR